jgi:hypothetical protein
MHRFSQRHRGDIEWFITDRLAGRSVRARRIVA